MKTHDRSPNDSFKTFHPINLNCDLFKHTPVHASLTETQLRCPTDMPETSIPVLPALGNATNNYLVWSDKMMDFLSNYRSCYTGALLSYLICEDEMGKVATSATYKTLDQFLIESMQFSPAINPVLSKKINYWQQS
jgi:hypothetical protein